MHDHDWSIITGTLGISRKVMCFSKEEHTCHSMLEQINSSASSERSKCFFQLKNFFLPTFTLSTFLA